MLCSKLKNLNSVEQNCSFLATGVVNKFHTLDEHSRKITSRIDNSTFEGHIEERSFKPNRILRMKLVNGRMPFITTRSFVDALLSAIAFNCSHLIAALTRIHISYI